MIKKLLNRLRLEETRNRNNLDSPDVSLIHTAIIRRKVFLRRLYEDFYRELRVSLPSKLDGKCIVELGSGGGFIKEVIPNVITSDIIDLDNVDRHFAATEMPFGDGTVDAFLMIDVLHHIPDTKKAFHEMIRCLKPGGKIVMIEPANTLWSRFVYKRFHHELFDPHGKWGLERGGPLSSANGAIPWIVFFRDRRVFERQFNALTIRKMSIHTPFRYIISGGLTIRQLLPSFLYKSVTAMERLLSPLNSYIGMFMTVELEKCNVR